MLCGSDGAGDRYEYEAREDDSLHAAFPGLGVNNICSGLPSATLNEAWSVDSLSRLRDLVASHGISLDMVPLPMSSSECSRAELPAIYLDKSPERDRAIDDVCQLIRNCAKAGIIVPGLPSMIHFCQKERSRELRGTRKSGTIAARCAESWQMPHDAA